MKRTQNAAIPRRACIIMKATLNGKYETDKNNGKASTTLSLNAAVGDSFLQASISDALALDYSQHSTPSFAFSLKKPNCFTVDYTPKGTDPVKNELPNVQFKFMNSLKLMERTVKVTYNHAVMEQRITVDGSVELNLENKMAVSHVLGTRDCTLKYTYAHGGGIMFEPTYEFATKAWAFALMRKFEEGDALKASYQAAKKTMALEWSRNSKDRGTFKISASLDVKDKPISPKLMAESTWSYEL